VDVFPARLAKLRWSGGHHVRPFLSNNAEYRHRHGRWPALLVAERRLLARYPRIAVPEGPVRDGKLTDGSAVASANPTLHAKVLKSLRPT
jgi:hypothetical protein